MSSFYKKDLFLNARALDIETTGVDPSESEIMEWGVVPFHIGKAITKMHGISSKLDPEISAVTHLIDSDLDGLPLFDTDTADELVEVANRMIMVCHNTRFEKAMLANHKIELSRSLCTLRMAKKLYGADENITSFKLTYLRYALKLDVSRDIVPHRAVPDAVVTAKLFEHLVDKMEQDGLLEPEVDYYEQIDAWLAEPIWVETMPFGKYKGEHLSKVPLEYWEWALSNIETLDDTKFNYDPDFAASVFKVIEEQL